MKIYVPFRLFSTAAIVTAAFAQTAAARDWPSTASWDVFEGDGYCGMSQEYEGKGETHLIIGRTTDGDGLVMVTNDSWSAKKDAKYDLEFHVGGNVFSGGDSTGTEEGSRKGFVSKFGPDFFPALAAGSGLAIYLGETLVDNLRLTGSAAALATVNRCVSGLKAVAAAADRERKRFSHIPDDPFANAKVPPSAAAARGDPTSWISADDYPPSAIRAGAEGRVTVALTIGTLGRVSNCKVVNSSNNVDLDAATCRAVTRRARYNQATDDKGTPIESVVSYSVNWALPVEPPPASTPVP